MRSERDNFAYVLHMLDSINKLEKYTRTNTKDDFVGNDWDQDAVVRNLEIIGEAANNLDESFKQNYSDIPWRKIIDLRNVIVHDYADIDISIIWNILVNYIPELKLQIISIIDSVK